MIAIEPIRVLTDAETLTPAPGFPWLSWILALAVVAGLAAAAWSLGRARSVDGPELAFRSLARRLGVRRQQRRRVRTLADAEGAAPVVLLLCESAFERAVTTLEQRPEPPTATDRAALLELRHRLFG